MQIDNVKLFIQNDSLWRDEIMTYPIWQKKPDTIKEYGCLLISLVNAYNLYKKQNILKPSCFNNLLKATSGYYYLKFDENCPRGQESFLYWPTAMQELGIEFRKEYFLEELDFKHPKKFYIVRTKYKNTGHYSIVIGGTLKEIIFYDSYIGEVKKSSSFTKIIEIIFY